MIKPYHPLLMLCLYGTYMSISIVSIALMNAIDSSFTAEYLKLIGFIMISIGCIILFPLELSHVKLGESIRKEPIVFPIQLVCFLGLMFASLYVFYTYCVSYTGFGLEAHNTKDFGSLMFIVSSIGILVNLATMLFARYVYSRAYLAL